MSAGGAKLQPIAALSAVLLLIWGVVAAASVVGQSQINHKLGLWPSAWDSWAAWSIVLSFAAAVVGVPAIVCGIVGLRRRAALHVGGLLVLASIACTLVALVIDNVKFDLPWFGDDQSVWRNYDNGLTWHELPAELGFQRWWFFAEYLLLPFAVVVLLVWLVVVLTGAGRRARASAPLGYAYVAAPQADYRHVVAAGAPEAPATDAAAPERQERQREVPPTTEPRDVPAPVGAEPEPEPVPTEPQPEPQPEPPAETQPATQSETPPADHERVWFVTVQGVDHGPYSRTQLRSYLDEGRLHEGTVTHLAGGADQALTEVLR